MSDIVERLRAMAPDSIGSWAADTIERQEDELERLRAESSAFEQAWKDACARAEKAAEELAAAKSVIDNIVESEVEPLKALLREAADAADDVGVKYFDTDWLSDEVQRLKNITRRIRTALGDES